MISTTIAAAIGATAGAVALGTVSAVHGDPKGLAVALQHIPTSAHGYAVVSAVKTAMANRATATAGSAGTGAGIGAAVRAVAKSLSAKAAAVVGH